MKKLISLLILIMLAAQVNEADCGTVDTSKVWGITIDAVNNLNAIKTSLQMMSKKPTVRIVFDEWIPASEYVNAVNQLSPVSYIMGELLDSYYMSEYNLNQYKARANDYLSTLGNKVDIWEVGNEINGEWLGNSNKVVEKIHAANRIFKAAGKKTAITLYYNYDCWSNPKNEMFRWVNAKLLTGTKLDVDYVWVSYYEDDCNGYQPDWQKVFDSLHVIFPNAKIGIGECGTTNSSQKAQYMARYYKLKISTPNYVGGYFWWYYKQDCVPYTKVLWGVLDSLISGMPFSPDMNYRINYEDVRQPEVKNYPNPFNPSTRISYTVSSNGLVLLRIFDSSGREISSLVNQIKPAGTYYIDFNASGLPSGIYYCSLNSSGRSFTNKMILIK